MGGRWLRDLAMALAMGLAETMAQGMDLVQAWRLALQHDPQLRGSRAEAQALAVRLPQARAHLLPSITGQVERNRSHLDTTGPDVFGRESSSTSRFNSKGDVLSLRQPIYRKEAWAQYRLAQYADEEARARLEQANRTALLRVTDAYFAVLLAQDQVEVIRQQELAQAGQLEAARSGQAGGAGTRADVDEAQARLDLTRAQALEARENLSVARLELDLLIAEPAGELAPLDASRLTLQPPPGDQQELTRQAQAASPELRTLQAQLEQARQAIEAARGAHWPTLDALLQVSRSVGENVTRIDNTFRQRQIGLVLAVPLYQGGLLDAQVREALARMERADAQLDGSARDLELRVHRERSGMVEGAARIQALEQAVKSAQQLVVSNTRSFDAGMRTRVDILNAQQQLATVRRDLAKARYGWLSARMRLGSLIGTSDEDLAVQANAALAGTGR